MTWEDAQARCKSENSHLVSINSHEELRLVNLISQFTYHGAQHIFIGMGERYVSTSGELAAGFCTDCPVDYHWTTYGVSGHIVGGSLCIYY